MKRNALIAIGPDKTCIVAALSKSLFEHDCSIGDSIMTVIEDSFAIILIISTPSAKKRDSLIKDLKKIEKAFNFDIIVKELGKRVEHLLQPNSLITLHGVDRPGVLFKISDLLSQSGISIIELETKTIPAKDGSTLFVMVIEAHAASTEDLKGFKNSLRATCKELGVDVNCKPLKSCEPA
ncbi:MAG: ACT domain-containing protein [Deltaproteobacteria bacterium]|nr:ACT domain-containing protein [Deltaproteobacteria bacterium]